ncbi:MAG TPA: hypothetical protein VMT42_05765 [candidate division Zixibacteria bacterium]|nr:hypothetical protein [candidate division Zixibacteria bacterium]
MSEFEGCILRIATRQWVEQVFGTAIYFTNLRRKWKKGQTILFVHKTSVGDALVGYGLIERAWEKDELSEQDRGACERGGWKRAIEFRYVKQFDKPLAVKETFLKGSKHRGRYFHGLKLDKEQLKAILDHAEA